MHLPRNMLKNHINVKQIPNDRIKSSQYIHPTFLQEISTCTIPKLSKLIQKKSNSTQTSPKNQNSAFQYSFPNPSLDLQFALKYDPLRILSSKQMDLSNPLINSSISKRFRSKMVDWMLEVFSFFSEISSQQTFFHSIALFDYYIKKSPPFSLLNEHVYTLGITSIFLASKVCDENKISLKEIKRKMLISLLDENQILKMEISILNVFNFKVYFSNLFDFCGTFLGICFIEFNTQFSGKIKAISIGILKLILADADFYQFSNEVLTFSVIFFTFEILISLNYIFKDFRSIKSKICMLFSEKFGQSCLNFEQSVLTCQVFIKKHLVEFEKHFGDHKMLFSVFNEVLNNFGIKSFKSV